ncbi:hypothetical protein [Poriferisphaera corsica]|uniref:hypothetical protein n=1 Tax=Poriferisphaera corsica TaxID=2528020 RepID=UPI0011A0E988|nr:hypothetical protein [Poriferisphaera corsica]
MYESTVCDEDKRVIIGTWKWIRGDEVGLRELIIGTCIICSDNWLASCVKVAKRALVLRVSLK